MSKQIQFGDKVTQIGSDVVATVVKTRQHTNNKKRSTITVEYTIKKQFDFNPEELVLVQKWDGRLPSQVVDNPFTDDLCEIL